MRTSLTRAGMITAAATGLVLGLAACSSGSDAGDSAAGEPEGTVRVVEEPAGGGPATTIDAGEGDYVFGLGRESIAETITETFSSNNAEAVWEGDTLVVTMDGDAEGAMAGFTECRVITEFVEEGDSVAIVYPNGRVECAEVLGG